MSSPTSNINSGNNNEKEKLLKNIEDLNALKLRCQRSRYNELEKKHYWKSTPVSIADETDGGGGGVTDTNNDGSSNTEGGGGTSMHHVAPGDDPLSSALLSSTTTSDTTTTTATTAKNEASSNLDKSTKLFGGGIFGSGSHPKGGSGVSIRARRRGSNDNPNSSSFNNNNNGNTNGKSSGSILSDSFTSATSSLNDGSDHNTNGGGGGDEAVCKGSRWADFYSTREVLDVIEKDLVRLPANHYTIYHEWRIKNIEWKEDREKEDKWQREQLRKDLEEEDDTLQSLSEGTTIIQMQQQPLGKPLNKKKTNWKLSESFSFGGRKGAKSAENLAALLGADEEDEDEEQKRDENARAEVQNSIKERAGRISQILFVYAREHPEIGYRQGMHEVLSYILLALEMDLLEQAITTERNSWRDNSTSFGLLKDKDSSGKAAHGGMAGVDSSGNLVVVRLLDEKYILHDAFNVFEHIMTSLAPAYDAIPLGDEAAQSILEEAKAERGESPMESMTSSIVSKIRFVARDEQLFGHVLYMPVPPQLYFAKWIRLMFGRELAGGMKNVLRLWDAFFELASARVSTQDDVPVTVALLDVLKTAAASMILLIRHKLLAPSMAPDGTMTGEPDPNNGIGYLMNYPPLEDIGSLVEMISKLLKREQKLSSQHKMLREKTFSQSHTISSIDEHPLEVGERTNASRSRNDPETPPPDDPLSVNLKEDTHGSGERNIFMQTIQDEGPHGYNRVNDGAESYDSQGGQPQLPKNHIKVAESLGHIAEGLMDFGSKTASAAIASIQNKYDVALEHPLQQFNNAAASNDQEEDYVINYRPVGKQRTASVIQLPIGEKLQLPIGENDSEHDLVERLLEEEEEGDSATESEGLDDSFASKLSVSRSIGESLQKNPKELAAMLERSVDTLMRHFNERMISGADLAEDDGMGLGGSSHNNIDYSQHSSSNIIPDEIWDAMAEVDRVRKELLHQDALTSMDHAKSSSSLKSSINSGSSRRRRSRRQSRDI